MTSRTIERLAGMGIKASRASEVHDALRIQDPGGFNVDLYSSRAH